VPRAVVVSQIDAVVADVPVAGVKTGMLATSEIVEAVADRIRIHELQPLVVDPVLNATAGGALLEAEAMVTLREQLLPLCTVFTPNLPEAEAFLGKPVRNKEQMLEAAAELADLGPGAVLLKGGHLEGDTCADLLWIDGIPRWFEAPRLTGTPLHGTGCTLSAAVTAGLASGWPLEEACARAKSFVGQAIEFIQSASAARGVAPRTP
jgi:hydroxymethylpyrimidine/phosphomethylpyrimidine kinase